MNSIVVIGSRNTAGKNDPETLARAVKAVHLLFWEDLILKVSKGEVKVYDPTSDFDLKEASLVLAVGWYKNGDQAIYRDVALSLGEYLNHHKVKFWNSEMTLQRSTTKLSAMVLLALNGFDVPETYFSLSNDNMMKGFNKGPVIIKDAAASRGRNNYLINNSSELEGYIADQDGPNRYLMQEYIPNDGDLRIVCFGSSPKLVIERRGGEGTHLNNTSKGGQAELKDVKALSEELVKACEQICQMMGREMAGIDLVPSNDGLSRQVFLEINAIPQLTSGSFIDEKLEALSQTIGNLDQKG